MIPRMPDYMKQGTIDQQRRWHLWKMAERTASKERLNVELEVKMGRETEMERKAG
jgi:5-carboxymethyl-2-hydroxymuconate isomerase